MRAHLEEGVAQGAVVVEGATCVGELGEIRLVDDDHRLDVGRVGGDEEPIDEPRAGLGAGRHDDEHAIDVGRHQALPSLLGTPEAPLPLVHRHDLRAVAAVIHLDTISDRQASAIAHRSTADAALVVVHQDRGADAVHGDDGPDAHAHERSAAARAGMDWTSWASSAALRP